MPSSAPIVGIDLGGTNMQIGVVGDNNAVLGAARRKTNATEGLDAVIDRLIDGVHTACEQANVHATDLAGLGIGAPGAIEPDKGVVLEAVNLRWNNVPLAQILRDRLGIPVMVDNDVNVAVFGEWKAGAGAGVNDLLGIWIGTGIGGGLVLGGRLYQGAMRTAGEIGQTILFPGNPFGERTLEQNCSRTAVAHRLSFLVLANEPSSLAEVVTENGKRIKSKIIAKAYADEDPLTVRIVNDAADLIGVAAANAVTLLSIPRIVLGGGLTEAAGQPFVDRVSAAMRQHVFPDRCRDAEVVASMLEDDAGVIGAALLARETLAR